MLSQSRVRPDPETKMNAKKKKAKLNLFLKSSDFLNVRLTDGSLLKRKEIKILENENN